RLRGCLFERVLRDAMDRNRIPGPRAFSAAQSRGHMRRRFTATLAFLLLAVAGSARAQPPTGGHAKPRHAPAAHGEEDGEKENVADFIFHHVADAPEYEIEIPLKQNGHNIVLHLPVIRIPLAANACPSDPHEAALLSKGCLDLSITKHVLMMWL